MSDLTPVLGLVRQYLEDYGDKRVDNINWDKLDKLFHPYDGHKHDGVDSPVIDLEPIWRAIFELRKITAQLRIDLTELDIREWLHYQEYIKHKHYALDAPPSIETHWFDTFNNYEQSDLTQTSAAISASVGALHLPQDYIPNEAYHFVSKPFRLAHTLVANPNPDVQPDQAYARIVQEREGIVTPYIAIGDNLTPNPNDPRIYAGARAGVQQRISLIDSYNKKKITYEGKIRGSMTVPHVAWHYYDLKIPIITTTETRTVVVRKHRHRGHHHHHADHHHGWHKNHHHHGHTHGHHGHHNHHHHNHHHHHTHTHKSTRVSIKRSYKVDIVNYRDREEFLTSEYNKVTTTNGDRVITGDGYTQATPTYEEVPYSEDYRILYNAEKALAWGRATNKWYWYSTTTKTATEIPKSTLGPIHEDNMINVAACLDPFEEGHIWIFKSWIVSVDKPNGFVDLYHQVIRWDGGTGFEQGKKWRASRHKRKHWPARIICPTRLRVDHNKIYPMCVFDFHELKDDGEVCVNYYDGDHDSHDHHDNWVWFPWKKLYGDLHKKRSHVTFAYFNPGIIGTVHSMSRKGEWVCTGSADVIRGAYDPTSNKWAYFSEEQINAFEGANDCFYLGDHGNELYFYQSFCPYDGYWIHREKKWKDAAWRRANPDYSWHGVVAYNISTGTTRHIIGNLPNKINCAGSLHWNGGEIVLVGGMELIKQWVTADGRIIATINNVMPTGTQIVYSFWADRQDPNCVVADRVTLQDEIDSHIRFVLGTTTYTRVVTTSISITVRRTHRTHHGHCHHHRHGHHHHGGHHHHHHCFRVRWKAIKVRVTKRVYMGILDKGRPRQIYTFDAGDDIEIGDLFKLYVNAKSEGKLESAVAGGTAEDINIYAYGDQDWVKLKSLSNSAGLTTIDLNDETLSALGEVTIMIESGRVSDRASKQAAFLLTDHIYLAVTKQNYVYEYEWEDLPDGQNAVVMLECSGGEDASGEIDLGDATGVWVESAEFSIIANIEG